MMTAVAALCSFVDDGQQEPQKRVDKMTADEKYEAAMAESEALLARMRVASNSDDPAIALMADIWSQRENVPFMTTVYEAAQEVLAPRAKP